MEKKKWGMPAEYKLFLELNQSSAEKDKEEDFAFEMTLDPEENFMMLLKSAGVKSEFSWTDTLLKVDQSHPAFKALPLQKRLAVFNNYLAQLKVKEEEEAKSVVERNRKLFLEVLEGLGEKVQVKGKWRECKQLVREEPVYLLLGEDECRELFEDYLWRIESAIYDKEDKQEEEDCATLSSFYKLKFGDTIVTWENANAILSEFVFHTKHKEEKHKQLASKLKTSLKRMSALSKLNTFIAHIEQLEEAANEQKKKREAEVKYNSRKLREKFRKLLDEIHSQGKIFSFSSWAQFLEDKLMHQEMLSQFLDVDQYVGTCPRDLFYDYLEENLEREALETKEKMLKIFKEIKCTVEADTNLAEMEERMNQVASTKGIQLHKRYTQHILEEMKQEALSEQKERQEKCEKAGKTIYEYFLFDYFDRVEEDTTWEHAVKWIQNRSAFQTLQQYNSEHVAEQQWNLFFGKFQSGELKKSRSGKRKNEVEGENEEDQRKKKQKPQKELEEGEIE